MDNVAFDTDKNIKKTKPFLRWAGGKSWLVKHLPSILGEKSFNCYFEPFLGGAAVFFELNPKKAVLSDACFKLINCYQQIQTNVIDVIDIARSFSNSEEQYYKIRDATFNSLTEQAAQFIYLNKTSFNGLYRESSVGKYNVPYGFRSKYLIDLDEFLSVSKTLQGKQIIHQDFGDIINSVKENDLVFLDPPYTVSHNNNGFIEYNQNIFKLEDQFRLSTTIDMIKEKGAYYILTNAAHKKIKEIFNKEDKILELNRASTIGGKNAKRENVGEYIFTNIK